MTGLAADTSALAGESPAYRPTWLDAALFALASIVQWQVILNPDLGWLLTVCDKMLGGAQLGRDVIELNPPLNVLIYMPAAWVGSTFGLPEHLVLIPMVLGLAFLTSRFTAQILLPLAPGAGEQDRLRACLLFLLIVFPGETFAQREHIAVIASLPFVALTAVAASGHLPSRRQRIIVGIGGGFALCLRPHYALVLGLPMLWNAVRYRSPRAFVGAETIAATAVVLAYAALILIAFPGYLYETSHVVALAYLPVRMSYPELLWFRMGEYAAGLCLITLALRGCGRASLMAALPWVLASIGGLIGYLLQGKGFTYSHLPLCLFAMLAGLTSPALLRGRLALWRYALAIIAAFPLYVLLTPFPNEYDDLDVPVRQWAPPRPKMLQISHYVGLGEPLVRRVDGTWVSGAGSQLITGSAIYLLQFRHDLTAEHRAALKTIMQAERDRLREDMIRSKPDVLLIDHQLFGMKFEWLTWARGDPIIAHEIDLHYVEVTQRHKVSLWFRRETMRQPAPQ